MLLSGIASSSFQFNPQSVQTPVQQVQQEFQQLGQDLQSGNLSAAQSDFASLTSSQQSLFLQPASNSPIAQALNQLSQDLQAGNLSGAKADYKAIQQDFQSQSLPGHSHHHHHRAGSSQSGGSNPLSQLFQQLGQALQSGNLSAAQQAYSALAQDLPQFGQSGATLGATAQPGSNGVSVTV
jgi:outer membrane protein assembly factor BamD (BamD/ComL family)